VAINKEIIDDQSALAELIPGYKAGDKVELESVKAIEVGNIFKLGTKYSNACGLHYADKEGKPQEIIMGCYGFGSSRVMGTIAEVLSDDKGLVWPDEVAPYRVHLVSLFNSAEEMAPAQALYDELTAKGIEIIWDDRLDARAGEKFADADLIGIPHRVVISKKTVEKDALEYKARTATEGEMISKAELFAKLGV
jgi:prolyl-tRNA synthetase